MPRLCLSNAVICCVSDEPALSSPLPPRVPSPSKHQPRTHWQYPALIRRAFFSTSITSADLSGTQLTSVSTVSQIHANPIASHIPNNLQRRPPASAAMPAHHVE
eukprot:7379851-Prymnesium_polylepis.2